jgi:hypothetical protein
MFFIILCAKIQIILNSPLSILNYFVSLQKNLLKRQDFENYNKLFSPSIACAKHAGTVTKT